MLALIMIDDLLCQHAETSHSHTLMSSTADASLDMHRPVCWQVAVMSVCGVIAFFMTDLPYYKNAGQYPGTSLSSPYLPVILSMLASYIVAECFFNVRPPTSMGSRVFGAGLGTLLPCTHACPSSCPCWPATSLPSASSMCVASPPPLLALACTNAPCECRPHDNTSPRPSAVTHRSCKHALQHGPAPPATCTCLRSTRFRCYIARTARRAQIYQAGHAP